MAATYAATGGIDGRVSIEVEPGLAKDTDATIGAGERTCGRSSTGPTC